MRWLISIDTGGTFTDCLGWSPHGELHRAKVLSSGAMRGRLKAFLAPDQILISQNWNVCDDLVKGFSFRPLGHDGCIAHVVGFDAARSVVALDSDVASGLPVGSSFELLGPEPAPILAARLVTRTPAGAMLPPLAMRLATTRGTNALLERRGAPTALFITRGFGDLLEIGDQRRPDLFALNIIRPRPLYQSVVEVEERLSADGSVLLPLNLAHVETAARRLLDSGIRSAAVALMHSHCNPEHEQRIAALLADVGFEHVSCSADLVPLIKLLPRAHTAVIDAYVGPVIHTYLDDVQRYSANGESAASRERGARDQSTLHVMTSTGGIVSAGHFRGCDSLLSGPAGGVAGAAAAGRAAGFRRVIGFDMGGTSTDVARFDGDFEYRFEHSIADVPVMTPMLAIETVASGGGSICRFQDGVLQVGPDSSGSMPGPACYGSGGPLTITDVNLLLGRIDPAQFEIPIDPEPAKNAAGALLERVRECGLTVDDPATLLQGLLDIADERMSAAIAQVSIRQGYDPREYALVAFGGAGGQHACAIAERLGIQAVVLPEDASLLSALGLAHSPIERIVQRQVLRFLDECAEDLRALVGEMQQSAIDAVTAETLTPDHVRIRRVIVNLRLQGQDSSLAIETSIAELSFVRLRREFTRRYRDTYGHEPTASPQRGLEVESVCVVASSVPDEADPTGMAGPPTRNSSETASRTVRAYFQGEWSDVPALERELMSSGTEIVGPSLVVDRRSVAVIQPGWTGVMDAAGSLILRRHASAAQPVSAGATNRSDAPAVVIEELFRNRFAAVAEEMGRVLQRTAISTNVKERLDFSCALLDAAGELIVNAPHIPVHLGALGMCVRAVRERITMGPGDVIITNHPAFGGSHLPDVTVITPVYVSAAKASGAADGELIGYTASRAHHAEIGGSRPGSMPPDATSLASEGVVIPPMHIVRAGIACMDHVERLLRESEFPSRAVADNLADIQAAIAANHRGTESFRELVRAHGSQTVAHHMDLLKSRAELRARQALTALTPGRREAQEKLDDGSPIRVSIDIQADRAVIDFAGSAPVHPGNLNATPAIVRSAVIYVLRLLIGERLPLNEGLMRAVEVCIPPGMLNPPFGSDPRACPAVVGGNTETSQRVVDTLLKAFGLCACSQGTMNNVIFGNERFGYYETICGGSGAGPGFDGTSAVHTHMTNTRITDPEIIEQRYPARVESFAIRRRSGGDGAQRGGDGARREVTFLEPVSLSIVSQHRIDGPYGAAGGLPGAPGRQCVRRSDGSVELLGSIDACELRAGDRLVVETPGGGGWGPPPAQ